MLKKRVVGCRGAYFGLCLMAATVTLADVPPPLLTGEVFSREAQVVIVPQTNNWQSRISKLAPEGSYLNKGDLVVEFDGTESARQLEQQREAARTEQAKTERDLARLDKEVVQADFQLRQAEVTLELAALKAETPRGVIGAIEFADNQLALEDAMNAQENALKNLDDKRKGLDERRTQARLDLKKVEVQEEWWREMLASMKIFAERSGYVIYGNHPWTRAKFVEGDNVMTSFHIAQVADTTDLAIKVWINGVDKPRVHEGDAVTVTLDALADRAFSGQIELLSDSGSKRQEWGKADYFEAIVSLDNPDRNVILPGMSALVEVK